MIKDSAGSRLAGRFYYCKIGTFSLSFVFFLKPRSEKEKKGDKRTYVVLVHKAKADEQWGRILSKMYPTISKNNPDSAIFC